MTFDYRQSLQKLKLNPKNKELIIKFLDENKASQVLGEKRLRKYCSLLPKLDKLVNHKSFLALKKDDLISIVNEINKFKPNTVYSYLGCLKRFYKWLGKPELTIWIKRKKIENTLEKRDLLTESEISDLIQVTNDYRYKSLISLAWQSGCRIGELLSMKLGDVDFSDKNLTHIHVVRSKTNNSKSKIPIIDDSILKVWVSRHPSQKPEDPLFCIKNNQNGQLKQLTYSGSNHFLKESAKKIRLDKLLKERKAWHLLRHSRLMNILETTQMRPDQVNRLFGWSKGSKVGEIFYNHLEDDDLSEVFSKLKINELMKKNDIEPNLTNLIVNVFSRLAKKDLSFKMILKEEIKKNKLEDIFGV